MAARKIGGSISQYISHGSSIPARFCISRGISNTLLIKGIPFKSTSEDLAESFSKFGELVEAKVIMNKDRNKCKGYGFVTFAREKDASKALTDMDGQLLDGRIISIKKVETKVGEGREGK